MDPTLEATEVHRLAAIELNLLNLAHTLPGMPLDGAQMEPGTAIYDPGGEVLFYRVSLRNRGARVGYADLAAHTLFGAPLLATAPDATWDPDAWIAQARTALRQTRHEGKTPLTYDEVRLVAFSFPKLAVQFLAGGKEVVMLELATWAVVPPTDRNRRPMEPSNFERFSLIEEMPNERKRDAHGRFEEHVSRLNAAPLTVTTGEAVRHRGSALQPPLHGPSHVLRAARPGNQRLVCGGQCANGSGFLSLQLHAIANRAAARSRNPYES